MRGAAKVLPKGGAPRALRPVRVDGHHTAPSNEAFDASLRARNPAWGVRDLRAVDDIARLQGLHLRERVEMPANNLTVVFART